jgi:hypothetical protein
MTPIPTRIKRRFRDMTATYRMDKEISTPVVKPELTVSGRDPCLCWVARDRTGK